MKLLALLLLLWLPVGAFAQTAATPTADGNAATIDPSAEDEPATASLPALESPFLQDDLELIVGNVQRPNGIHWFEGSLFTICNGDWTIYKIDTQTTETVTFVFGVRNGNSLIAEATEAGFDIWVPDPDTSNLWHVDQSRAAPVSISSDLEAPWGITRAGDGQFLLTDTSANAIIEVGEDGKIETLHDELRSPTGIVHHGGYVYFANGGSARRGIEYFELREDGNYSEIKPLVSGLQNTSNILMSSDGYLYFAYALGTRGVIGRVDPEKCYEEGCSTDDTEMVVFSDVPAPLAITLSDDGRLYLHSRYRPEIYWAQLPV